MRKNDLTGMKIKSTLIGFSWLILSLSSCAQEQLKKDTVVDVIDSTFRVEFTPFANGMSYCETFAPKTSKISDCRFTILKLDPKTVDFELFVANENNISPRTVDQWADTFDLQVVFNAGMYDLSKPLISRGLLKHGNFYNQRAVHPAFNLILALDPIDSTLPSCAIFDLQITPLQEIQRQYKSLAQGLRMLDGNGNATEWKKKPQSCSMMLAAQDFEENVYLIFSRSPYTHNQMIGFLKQFPFKLKNAIYLEGGPETSLYVNLPITKQHPTGFCLEKVGSYVSNTYANDENSRFWKLPNVIGVKVR